MVDTGRSYGYGHSKGGECQRCNPPSDHDGSASRSNTLDAQVIGGELYDTGATEKGKAKEGGKELTFNEVGEIGKGNGEGGDTISSRGRFRPKPSCTLSDDTEAFGDRLGGTDLVEMASNGPRSTVPMPVVLPSDNEIPSDYEISSDHDIPHDSEIPSGNEFPSDYELPSDYEFPSDYSDWNEVDEAGHWPMEPPDLLPRVEERVHLQLEWQAAAALKQAKAEKSDSTSKKKAQRLARWEKNAKIRKQRKKTAKERHKAKMANTEAPTDAGLSKTAAKKLRKAARAKARAEKAVAGPSKDREVVNSTNDD
ncbi:hypothetical protein Agabi119p4_10357 [Agaricus bisporus var. burnettii]|uniref:Uncharacterized protein n=1 Tax=Agaricus bisporus var. burnettii TaxID=192524 RepID=A0A8H7C2D3_AGABI|nr:hypothetical protein Agabi119p4_10357 [Agaricus bisporus var. burnettii]